MSSTIRYPLKESSQDGPGLQQERDQIILLSSAVVALPQGGVVPYTSILPWHRDVADTETPYCPIVIEFRGSAVGGMTIGDGTVAEMIGLFGRIDAPGDASLVVGDGMYLLGVLGIILAGTKPQIPIISDLIGYAQVVNLVGVYDGLAVGGINGDIAIVGGTLDIRARPIRRRDYGG